MPRPHKCRRINQTPDTVFFKPAGVMMQNLDEVEITFDELEAIRLADLEGLYQEQAALKMNISRQTFGNIISSAHNKIADFLVNGKALRINGGVVDMNTTETRSFICYECKISVNVPFGMAKPGKCPKCGSNNIHRSPDERGNKRRGSGNCKNSNV